jgi:hypothetical protein
MRTRWPLFAAIGFAVLFVLAQVVAPVPPDIKASGDRIVAYYRAHGDAVRLGVWLVTLAGLPFVALVAWFRSRVDGIGRDVLLVGGAGIAASTAVWTWISAGLALHPSQLDPHTARTLTDVGAYYGPVLTLAVSLLAAPIGWEAFRGDRSWPRWVGWLTAVLVIEQLAETVTIFGKSGFIAPGGAMNFALGAPLFVVWVIAVAAGSTRSQKLPAT